MASQALLFRDFLVSNSLAPASTNMESTMLAFVGVQNPDVWKLFVANLLEDMLGEEKAKELELSLLSGEEIIKLAASLWKKIAPVDRERVFKTFLTASGAAIAARRSITRDPSPPPRAPRQAAQEAKAMMGQLLNERDGPNQTLTGQRLPRDREPSLKTAKSDDESSSTNESDSERNEESDKEMTYTLSRSNFKNPKILLQPKKWIATLNSGATTSDLLRELRTQLSVDKMLRDHPNEWTTTIHSALADLVIEWISEPRSLTVPEHILQIMFRFHLYAQGANKNQIEEGMQTLMGSQLPKKFRDAQKKASKASTKKETKSFQPRERSNYSAKPSGRVPPEVWKTLTQAQKDAIQGARSKK